MNIKKTVFFILIFVFFVSVFEFLLIYAQQSYPAASEPKKRITNSTQNETYPAQMQPQLLQILRLQERLKLLEESVDQTLQEFSQLKNDTTLFLPQNSTIQE